MIWWLLPCGILLLALLPWLIDRLRPPVTDEDRAEAPGEFAGLADGLTHCRWYGSAEGRVHVLVHGAWSDAREWEALCGFLVLGGARVLVYDLYGRGLSDRPAGRQDRAFFLRQLGGLIADRKIGGDMVLVGDAMGGAIAAAYAEAEPGQVGQLVLIAPTGLARGRSPFLDFCRRVPLLGDAVMALRGGRHLPQTADPETAAARRKAARSRGYLRSVLSSARGIGAERQHRDHAGIRRLGIPVLAIWGREDSEVPIRAMGELALANPEAHHAEIAGGGHDIARTHAREVAEAIRVFTSGARLAGARPGQLPKAQARPINSTASPSSGQ